MENGDVCKRKMTEIGFFWGREGEKLEHSTKFLIPLKKKKTYVSHPTGATILGPR